MSDTDSSAVTQATGKQESSRRAAGEPQGKRQTHDRKKGQQLPTPLNRVGLRFFFAEDKTLDTSQRLEPTHGKLLQKLSLSKTVGRGHQAFPGARPDAACAEACSCRYTPTPSDPFGHAVVLCWAHKARARLPRTTRMVPGNSSIQSEHITPPPPQPQPQKRIFFVGGRMHRTLLSSLTDDDEAAARPILRQEAVRQGRRLRRQ